MKRGIAGEYYRETDAKRRYAILERLLAEEGNTEENILRKRLFESRYGTGRRMGQADGFLKGWMELDYFGKSSGFFNMKRKGQKTMEILRKEWQLSLQETEIGQDVLYEEFCNLTTLYIQICRKGKSGGFGNFGAASAATRPLGEEVEDDVYLVACQVPEMLEAREELALFTRAASLTFTSQFPSRTDAFYKRMQM